MQILKLWLSIFQTKQALWELCNNFFGACLATFYLLFGKAKLFSSKATHIIKLKNESNFGLSLGRIVILAGKFDSVSLSHEIGHLRQSISLGPFYLPLVGIPSLIRAFYFSFCKVEPKENYYYFYTEAWADHLGGVYKTRNHKYPCWKSYLKISG